MSRVNLSSKIFISFDVAHSLHGAPWMESLWKPNNERSLEMLSQRQVHLIPLFDLYCPWSKITRKKKRKGSEKRTKERKKAPVFRFFLVSHWEASWTSLTHKVRLGFIAHCFCSETDGIFLNGLFFVCWGGGSTHICKCMWQPDV